MTGLGFWKQEYEVFVNSDREEKKQQDLKSEVSGLCEDTRVFLRNFFEIVVEAGNEDESLLKSILFSGGYSEGYLDKFHHKRTGNTEVSLREDFLWDVFYDAV